MYNIRLRDNEDKEGDSKREREERSGGRMDGVGWGG